MNWSLAPSVRLRGPSSAGVMVRGRATFVDIVSQDCNELLAQFGHLAFAGARILRRSGGLQEDKELRVIDMMDTTVTRMSGLIDNVLDFARGRLGGGITLSRDADRPLLPLLDVDELRTASPERSIETSFSVTEPVNCDRTRIGQLHSNLVGNALTHGATDEPVRVGAKIESGALELWVANAGEPIPESAMHKLFEPCFRGEVRDSRQGLGLGLHIASQIAQAHGGRIDVTSSSHETRFTFMMPLYRKICPSVQQAPFLQEARFVMIGILKGGSLNLLDR
jgi:phosphoserine phosphatase RsbU/P